jgi:hypothetical protein
MLGNVFTPNSGRPTERRCVVCGKTKGVTFHALQQLDGTMRSTAAHLGCFKTLRAQVERERAAAKR